MDKLIDKLNGDSEKLEKFSNLIYFMNKEVAKDNFVDFLDFCDLTLDDWNILKEWMKDNGLNTYN